MSDNKKIGRKPNWYKTEKVTVPVDLIPDLQRAITEYKIKGEQNGSISTDKAS